MGKGVDFMKLSNSFFYTLREDVKDEESISGNLLVKSGMIKKTSNGIYTFMPLGLKVLQNIENIITLALNVVYLNNAKNTNNKSNVINTFVKLSSIHLKYLFPSLYQFC